MRGAVGLTENPEDELPHPDSKVLPDTEGDSMSLHADCSICGARVWLNPNGICCVCHRRDGLGEPTEALEPDALPRQVDPRLRIEYLGGHPDYSQAHFARVGRNKSIVIIDMLQHPSPAEMQKMEKHKDVRLKPVGATLRIPLSQVRSLLLKGIPNPNTAGVGANVAVGSMLGGPAAGLASAVAGSSQPVVALGVDYKGVGVELLFASPHSGLTLRCLAELLAD